MLIHINLSLYYSQCRPLWHNNVTLMHHRVNFFKQTLLESNLKMQCFRQLFTIQYRKIFIKLYNIMNYSYMSQFSVYITTQATHCSYLVLTVLRTLKQSEGKLL